MILKNNKKDLIQSIKVYPITTDLFYVKYKEGIFSWRLAHNPNERNKGREVTADRFTLQEIKEKFPDATKVKFMLKKYHKNNKYFLDSIIKAGFKI